MIEITWDTLPYILLHVAVAVLGVARLTRAIVYDDFPPSVWVRDLWRRMTREGEWMMLLFCWWCLAFWVALACIGWWIGGQHVEWVAWAWWIFWGGLAIGYLAPMVIVRDGQQE
jgi:hypothetical protein